MASRARNGPARTWLETARRRIIRRGRAGLTALGGVRDASRPLVAATPRRRYESPPGLIISWNRPTRLLAVSRAQRSPSPQAIVRSPSHPPRPASMFRASLRTGACREGGGGRRRRSGGPRRGAAAKAQRRVVQLRRMDSGRPGRNTSSDALGQRGYWNLHLEVLEGLPARHELPLAAVDED